MRWFLKTPRRQRSYGTVSSDPSEQMTLPHTAAAAATATSPNSLICQSARERQIPILKLPKFRRRRRSRRSPLRRRRPSKPKWRVRQAAKRANVMSERCIVPMCANQCTVLRDATAPFMTRPLPPVRELPAMMSAKFSDLLTSSPPLSAFGTDVL